MTKTEKWIVFKLNGEELMRYTVRGTFAGELEATKEILAAGNNCKPEDIKAEITMGEKE